MAIKELDPFLPDQCNCAALRRAARYLSRFYDATLAKHGVRNTQYTMLAQIKQRGPITMLELADAMTMDRATVGHNLRPLERDGLVAIAVHAVDRRARVLTITKAGLKCVKNGRPAWAEAQALFDARFGKAEAAAMRRMMKRVVATGLGASSGAGLR